MGVCMKKLKFDEERAFQWLKEQADFGPRPAGSEAHKKLQDYLSREISPVLDIFRPHVFTEKFWNKEVLCKNTGGLIRGRNSGSRILLGSHFDTRPLADSDSDLLNRKEPVPGANDGASGIAVLLELSRLFTIKRPRCDVEIVFFDAEDWSGLDGKEVSLGAYRYVEDNRNNLPDKVIIIDMVGGKNLELDMDLHCFISEGSKKLTLELLRTGISYKYPAYKLTKPGVIKYIVCDHIPFIFKGIPSTILIDIDYPQWHTVSDTIENCSPFSLKQVGDVLYEYLK